MEKIDELKVFILKHKILLILGVIIIVLLGVGAYFVYPLINKEKLEENLLSSISLDTEQEDSHESCQVMVDIKGEIKTPGLYQLECSSRVQDVINLAGGLTTKADTSVLNLGKKVLDEMVIIIYSKDQVANFTAIKEEENKKQESCQTSLEVKNDACITSSDVVEPDIINSDTGDTDTIIGDTPVNNTISLNKATKEELMTLSGIGENKAESIILYREEHGGFKTIEEIKNIKGIGDSIFEKIKNNITV